MLIDHLHFDVIIAKNVHIRLRVGILSAATPDQLEGTTVVDMVKN